jgi:radical SAM protein with 4Fe4S-binding SPASM domain
MGLWVVSKRKFDVVRLRALLENAISKKVIESALTPEDGKTRIEHILDAYGNKNFKLGQRLKYYPIIKLLDIVRRSFKRTPGEFKESLKDPAIRKVILTSLRSLQKYGLSTPQSFASPLMVVWNYTNDCNLRCKHCYQDAGPDGVKKNELTTEERFNVVDQIAENDIPTIFFSGGEPVIRKDFWDVAEYARKEKGIVVSIASNGTLFNKENAKRAAEIGFSYIAVSLDSPDPEKHDEFRGVPGMWQRAVDGIRNLLDAGVTTCIQYTFAKDTKDELEGMFKLREDLDAYKLISYNYIPVGRGGYENDPTPEDRQKAYKIMYDELDAGHHVVATTDPVFGAYCKEHKSKSIVLAHYAELKAKELGTIAEIISGCGAGRVYCAIEPDGIVTPCVYMPDLPVGDLRKQSLKEIWENSPVLNSLRDRSDLGGACANCEYKAICGGCRARGRAYFGNLKAPDPGCIYNAKYYYDFMKSNSIAVSSA